MYLPVPMVVTDVRMYLPVAMVVTDVRMYLPVAMVVTDVRVATHLIGRLLVEQRKLVRVLFETCHG
jgi:hypothetical protein